MKLFQKIRAGSRRLHPFSRQVLRGCAQFSAVWGGFGLFLHAVAAYTPDYFRTLLYRDAALAVAPVILAVGIVAALLTDLVLRRHDP